MQKIAIKELVEFSRTHTDSGRKNFAYKLKNRKAKEKKPDDDSSGGDYWVTSTSCINNVFKHNKIERYDDKINELAEKVSAAEFKTVKSMFQRNIDILTSFKDFHIEDIRPSKILKFETVQRPHTIVQIDDFPLYVNPSVLFCHERRGKKELGAIWLVAQIDGFKKSELGMFCEMLYEFLIKNYSDNYQISEDLCIAIDTFKAQKISYQELKNSDTTHLVKKTLKEIKNL